MTHHLSGHRLGRAPLVLFVALALALGVGAVIAWYTGFVPGFGDNLSPPEISEALHKRNVAIGLMENHQDHDRAAQLFDELANMLPDEILPVQNAAICALDGMERAKEEQRTKWSEAARPALEKLLKKAPDSAAANYLMAHYLSKLPPSNDEEQQSQINREIIRLCQKAAAANSSEPGFPMKIFFVCTTSFDPEMKKPMETALQRAYEVAPHNLRILKEWLSVQKDKQDPGIQNTLANARELLGPLLLSMRGGDNLNRADGARGMPYELEPKIDAAIEAAKQGNWADLNVHLASINAALLTLMNYRDESKKLELDPLNFVVHDFSDSFYKRHSVNVTQEASDVAFRMVPSEFSAQFPTDLPVIAVRSVDVDLDRKPDWVVLCRGELRVYTSADGSSLTLLASAAIAEDARGFAAADLDNDNTEGPKEAVEGDERKWHTADLDFVVYGASGIQVLRNRVAEDGTRTLELVENPPELPIESPGEIHHAVPVDFDHDADLDLVLATASGIRLWSARGNGTFEEITNWSRLPEQTVQPQFLAAADWDRDVDMDILAASRSEQSSGALHNEQHGHMNWGELGRGFDKISQAHSLAVGEFDGNVSWDLVVAGRTGVRVCFTAAEPNGMRCMRTVELTKEARDHVLVADVDNNSYPDVLAWSDAEIDLFLGEADFSFRVAPANAFSPQFSSISDARLDDVDDDGDLDLLAVVDGKVELLTNDGASQTNWLKLRLIGDCRNDGCVGHTGIGSTLELKTGSRYQAQVVTGEVSHFGLGATKRADVLRIIPTNGIPQAIVQPDANQYLTEEVKLLGSCPYVYTWTGEKFEFFTDLLWAAPLGMQTSRGSLLPAREWEYIFIPGDRLKARDGTYDLQITEELWEAAYFDHVQLLAVDHPADVSVYSNEKVGPPDIAQFKMHSVRTPRTPVAASDQNGRDVLELIREQDENHVAPWDEYVRRGRTSLHYVELDLGKLENPQQIMLYLTGWILPAGTSLNMFYSQNADIGLPALPSIWTPDAAGQWRETVAYMGFPGGKTKTIAIDVSKAFAANDYRLRIVTSAQIYWDQIFFTVDEAEAPMQITPCELSFADLHYRGFSEGSGYHGTSPEVYDYQRVFTHPHWPPMRGNLTRYGDVLPLLTVADDHLLVLGSGDEVTVRFRVPEQTVPEGWKRDFVLHSVGWDKDADLNTVLGQSSEPLPYRGMTSYPYDPADGPAGAEYEKYLRTYQTRQQNPSDFWQWTKRWGE